MDELKNFIMKDFEKLKNKKKEVADDIYELAILTGNVQALSRIFGEMERIGANRKNGNRDN